MSWLDEKNPQSPQVRKGPPASPSWLEDDFRAGRRKGQGREDGNLPSLSADPSGGNPSDVLGSPAAILRDAKAKSRRKGRHERPTHDANLPSLNGTEDGDKPQGPLTSLRPTGRDFGSPKLGALRSDLDKAPLSSPSAVRADSAKWLLDTNHDDQKERTERLESASTKKDLSSTEPPGVDADASPPAAPISSSKESRPDEKQASTHPDKTDRGKSKHGKDKHGKDKHGKDKHGKDKHGKDKHGKDKHGKDKPHGTGKNKVPKDLPDDVSNDQLDLGDVPSGDDPVAALRDELRGLPFVYTSDVLDLVPALRESSRIASERSNLAGGGARSDFATSTSTVDHKCAAVLRSWTHYSENRRDVTEMFGQRISREISSVLSFQVLAANHAALDPNMDGAEIARLAIEIDQFKSQISSLVKTAIESPDDARAQQELARASQSYADLNSSLLKSLKSPVSASERLKTAALVQNLASSNVISAGTVASWMFSQITDSLQLLARVRPIAQTISKCARSAADHLVERISTELGPARIPGCRRRATLCSEDVTRGALQETDRSALVAAEVLFQLAEEVEGLTTDAFASYHGESNTVAQRVLRDVLVRARRAVVVGEFAQGKVGAQFIDLTAQLLGMIPPEDPQPFHGVLNPDNQELTPVFEGFSSLLLSGSNDKPSRFSSVMRDALKQMRKCVTTARDVLKKLPKSEKGTKKAGEALLSTMEKQVSTLEKDAQTARSKTLALKSNQSGTEAKFSRTTFDLRVSCAMLNSMCASKHVTHRTESAISSLLELEWISVGDPSALEIARNVVSLLEQQMDQLRVTGEKNDRSLTRMREATGALLSSVCRPFVDTESPEKHDSAREHGAHVLARCARANLVAYQHLSEQDRANEKVQDLLSARVEIDTELEVLNSWNLKSGRSSLGEDRSPHHSVVEERSLRCETFCANLIALCRRLGDITSSKKKETEKLLANLRDREAELAGAIRRAFSCPASSTHRRVLRETLEGIRILAGQIAQGHKTAAPLLDDLSNQMATGMHTLEFEIERTLRRTSSLVAGAAKAMVQLAAHCQSAASSGQGSDPKAVSQAVDSAQGLESLARTIQQDVASAYAHPDDSVSVAAMREVLREGRKHTTSIQTALGSVRTIEEACTQVDRVLRLLDRAIDDAIPAIEEQLANIADQVSALLGSAKDVRNDEFVASVQALSNTLPSTFWALRALQNRRSDEIAQACVDSTCLLLVDQTEGVLDISEPLGQSSATIQLLADVNTLKRSVADLPVVSADPTLLTKLAAATVDSLCASARNFSKFFRDRRAAQELINKASALEKRGKALSEISRETFQMRTKERAPANLLLAEIGSVYRDCTEIVQYLQPRLPFEDSSDVIDQETLISMSQSMANLNIPNLSFEETHTRYRLCVSTLSQLQSLASYSLVRERGNTNNITEACSLQISFSKLAIMGSCFDPSTRDEGLSLCEKLENVCSKLPRATKMLLSRPTDKQRHEECVKLVTQVRTHNDALKQLFGPGTAFDEGSLASLERRHLKSVLGTNLSLQKHVHRRGDLLELCAAHFLSSIDSVLEVNNSILGLLGSLTKHHELGRQLSSSDTDGLLARSVADIGFCSTVLANQIASVPAQFPTFLKRSLPYETGSLGRKWSSIVEGIETKEDMFRPDAMERQFLSAALTGEATIDDKIQHLVTDLVSLLKSGSQDSLARPSSSVLEKTLRNESFQAIDQVRRIGLHVGSLIKTAAKEEDASSRDGVLVLVQGAGKGIFDVFSELRICADECERVRAALAATISIIRNGGVEELVEPLERSGPVGRDVSDDFAAFDNVDLSSDEENVGIEPMSEAVQDVLKFMPTLDDGIEDSHLRNGMDTSTIPAYLNLFDFEFLYSDIFKQDFFRLEVERLRTKYEYDNERTLTGDIRKLQNVKYPKERAEFIAIAMRDETNATTFSRMGEFEWARLLIRQALMIRVHVFNAIRDENQEWNSSHPDATPRDATEMHFHMKQVEIDWEKYARLCTEGQPASDRSERGLVKTIELLRSAADLCPPQLRDGRCQAYAALWGNQVKWTLRLVQSVEHREGGLGRVVREYFTPVVHATPMYLSRNYEMLEILWQAILTIHSDPGQRGARMHGLQEVRPYLQELHTWFHSRMTENDALPPVYQAFPLFKDVCRELSQMALDGNLYMLVQAYSVEELMVCLEMDEHYQSTAEILDAWHRIRKCIKRMHSKQSDQFFILKEVQQELAVYNNVALKEMIQQAMNKAGSQREVIYNLKYSEQLQKCAQIFFGELYDEIADKLDSTTLLEEILSNLNSCAGSLHALMMELRKLGVLNFDFQQEMMKREDFHRAKSVLEDFLLLSRFTNPPSLDADGKVVCTSEVIQGFSQLVECVVHLCNEPGVKPPQQIQLLTECYNEHRPLYFRPFGPELDALWQRMLAVKEFRKETLESLFKRVALDKRKLLQDQVNSVQRRPPVSGWVTMRVSRTWQRRWFILQDQILYTFKSPSALRSSNIIPLKSTEVKETVDGNIVMMIPAAMRGNAFTINVKMSGPRKAKGPAENFNLSFCVYADTEAGRDRWVKALNERIAERVALGDVEDEHLETELFIQRELLARHPLALEGMHQLGKLWHENGHPEEALNVYIQAVEMAIHLTSNRVGILTSLWDAISTVQLETLNIYEILEFLEDEQNRWRACGLAPDHPLLKLIHGSLSSIIREDDLKMRYLYQIRKYKEVMEDIVPARIYHLNQIYADKFLASGAITEAIALTKDSLSLLARHLHSGGAHSLGDVYQEEGPSQLIDKTIETAGGLIQHVDKEARVVSPLADDVRYYHLSTWHKLVDLFILYAKERSEVGDFYGGRVLLLGVFEDLPAVGLDPYNSHLGRLVDRIFELFGMDPETAVRNGDPATESAAFQWLYGLYCKYDDEMISTYPSEAMLSRNVSVGNVLVHRATDELALRLRKDDFVTLVGRYPYILNLCKKMAKAYYVAHHMENALHMSRHALHIMVAVAPNRHREISDQWKLVREHFLAQKHSNKEVKRFILEEQAFASVWLEEGHPHHARIGKELSKLESRMAIYEKWVPALVWYVFYLAVFCALGYWLYLDAEKIPGYVDDFAEVTGVYLLSFAIFLDLGLLSIAMFFIVWPPLPNDTLHRTDILLKRKRQVKNMGLMIACHNSGDVLPQTLRAALRIFPPEHIYVCDNGNTPTPSDNSEDVCDKISREYFVQHELPLNSRKINYFYMPEGNKSLVFWYGAKYYCHFKFVMMIDDDVLLPPDLIIPMKRFKIPGTRVMAFTIGVENLHTHQGNIIYVSYWQDMEYKLAGFMKMFQSWIGSAIMAHGAISIWHRKTALEVLWNHDSVFQGDDLQMGLLLQKLGRNYRIDCVGNVNVPTTVPDHILCPSHPWALRCKCPGKDGNLLGQRVRSWDVATHRFLGKFLQVLLLHWTRTANSIKPFLIYELWSIIQDWVRLPLAAIILWENPQAFVLVSLLFLSFAAVQVTVFNFWVLRRRPDQQHPWRTFVPFPLYKLFMIFLRFIALWYNLLYYTPFVRNRQIIGTRLDLPLGPAHVAMINRLASEELIADNRRATSDRYAWKTIYQMIHREAWRSPPLSHWYLSCVSRLFFKDDPREKILAGNHLRSTQRVMGRTETFFYRKTAGMARIAPASFLTILNAMCFMTGRAQCFGPDPLQAVKVLKWLWLQEVLGEEVFSEDRVKRALIDFTLQASNGMSMQQFVSIIKEVVKPALQFLDMPAHLGNNILHLQLARDNEQWGLKSLSLTATDNRLIVRQFLPEVVRRVFETGQKMTIFVPLPSHEGVPVEPFRPTISHGALFLDPVEGYIMVTCPVENVERVYAVLDLLHLDLIEGVFQHIFALSNETGAARAVSWDEVHGLARKYFFNLSQIDPATILGTSDPREIRAMFEPTPEEIVQATKEANWLFDWDQSRNQVIRRHSISASGFWLLPVLDVLDAPCVFIDNDGGVVDSSIYFEPYGFRLDPAHSPLTDPLTAVKERLMEASGAISIASSRIARERAANHRLENIGRTSTHIKTYVFRYSLPSNVKEQLQRQVDNLSIMSEDFESTPGSGIAEHGAVGVASYRYPMGRKRPQGKVGLLEGMELFGMSPDGTSEKSAYGVHELFLVPVTDDPQVQHILADYLYARTRVNEFAHKAALKAVRRWKELVRRRRLQREQGGSDNTKNPDSADRSKGGFGNVAALLHKAQLTKRLLGKAPTREEVAAELAAT